MELRGLESSDPYLRDKAGRESINMPIQGLAADIAKYAMVKAQPLMKQLDGRVIHQEHDSILVEVPESYSSDASEALDHAMTEAIPKEIREVISIPSKAVVSSHWG
jgi:DNA polymerase I-like protein with 3'-5' exonuclease and polymerase domains